MSPKRRYVFDSNTITSALLLAQSVPGQAFHAAMEDGELLVSYETFSELNDLLRRDKFDRYVTLAEREQFLVTLLRDATLVDVTQEIHACRDPKDDMFLELAACGDASCLVTGDRDLLILSPFRGIPILTPAQFVDWLRQREDKSGQP